LDVTVEGLAVRFRRTPKTLAELAEAAVDADIAAVREDRIPARERRRLARDLVEGDAETSRYVDIFESGYLWGQNCEIFLWNLGDQLNQLIDASAGVFRETRDGRDLGMALVEARASHFIRNGEADGDSDAEAAFERLHGSGLAGLDERVARNQFRSGATFYAVETRILHTLRHLDRLDRLSRLRRK
jgi:hypothetical protein